MNEQDNNLLKYHLEHSIKLARKIASVKEDDIDFNNSADLARLLERYLVKINEDNGKIFEMAKEIIEIQKSTLNKQEIVIEKLEKKIKKRPKKFIDIDLARDDYIPRFKPAPQNLIINEGSQKVKDQSNA